MRREKKWRYYCEFCKKSGASGGHMSRHEKSCTLNPNRICRMCEIADEVQPNMSDMIEALSIAVVKEAVISLQATYTNFDVKDNEDEGTTQRGHEFAPGKWNYLNPGEDITVHSPSVQVDGVSDDWISYTIKKEKEAVNRLRDVANSCPACMLAALRQYGMPFLFKSFNFKEEKERFWGDINERDRQADHGY